VVSAAVILLILFTCNPAAAQSVSTTPSGGVDEAVTIDDLNTLVSTIENDRSRQQFLDQIRALIAVKKQAVPQADERPLSERLTEAAIKTVEETSQTFADVARYFRYRKALEDWVRYEISDPARLSQNAKRAQPLLWIFGLAGLVEILVARSLAGLRKRFEARAQTGLATRLPLSAARAGLRLCAPTAFAVAAMTVFFALQPGDAIGKVAFQVLAAYLTGRALMILTRLLLAPAAPSLRLVPLGSESARYLLIWIRRLVAVALVGYLLASIAILFGLSPRGFAGFMNLLVLILTVILIVFILKKRSAVSEWIRGANIPSAPSAVSQALRRGLAAVWHLIVIVYLLGLYIIWWQRIEGGFIYLVRSTLLSALVAVAAWLLLKSLNRAFDRFLTVNGESYRQLPSLIHRLKSYGPAVFIILRGAVFGIAILSVLEAWNIDAYSWLTTPVGHRILSVFCSIFLVVGIAVAIWEIVNIASERYLAESEKSGKTQSARTRTLLPLMRKALLIVLSVIVVLIALSEIGVHIGPLLAGAGIIGLAVGFGAQKLVQDVITGIFILLEDAVSVGDVVTVAGTGGLVEDLSIRSIRLRDLSGNVHTIPFSSVNTVTNMTKHYSYYLLDIGVAYRENTDDVADVCRQIVEEMRSELEFAKDILEPLEVLGVDQFADSAVILKARIKTRPIRQWAVGREFNRRMKKRFDELGIEIPFPHRTVYFGAGKDGAAPPVHVKTEAKMNTAESERNAD
jgi:small conductance mechanosensitive channel